MILKKLTISILLLGFLATLTSCETDEDNKIAQAQACVDSANAGSVGSCRQFLNGLSSTESYILRCSIDFIEQGFTASAMASAFRNLSNSTSTATSGFMGYMVFSSTTKADTAYSDCNSSGEQSYITIASFCQVATLAANAAGLLSGGSIDRSSSMDLTAGIAALIADSTTYPTVGNAVQNAYNANCSQPANASSDLCVKIVAAVNAGGNSSAIGLRFLQSL